MNAQEAEAAYRTARGQLDAKQIGQEEFNRIVAELKYQDNAGTWWAVSPTDGSWLKWDGSGWVQAFAQAVPTQPQIPVQQAAAQQPAVGQPATRTQVQHFTDSLRDWRQWPIGKKIATASIVFGIIAIFYAPNIFGIIAIALGIFAFIKKSRLGILGILLALFAMAINFLYIFIA